jgi:hypothetical protein
MLHRSQSLVERLCLCSQDLLLPKGNPLPVMFLALDFGETKAKMALNTRKMSQDRF